MLCGNVDAIFASAVWLRHTKTRGECHRDAAAVTLIRGQDLRNFDNLLMRGTGLYHWNLTSATCLL